VPVVAIPGQGYSLVEGFFLPPVTFSADEATMLLLGARVMADNFDAQYRAAAGSAARKIEAVLNQKLREEVHYLQQSIFFVSTGGTDPERLLKLRQAILERRTVRFVYHTRYPDSEARSPTPREADPYRLLHHSGAWYLTAHCHTRREIRHFRLDRMESLELLAGVFTRPRADLVRGHPPDSRPRDLAIRVLFDPQVARWVRESRFYFVVAEEERPEGLLVTLAVRQESEALQWLLGWGARAQVLEPDSLRRRIAAEAQSMLRNYQAELPSPTPSESGRQGGETLLT
jgi:predicted DNA-binding transcriptional regulator YafY